MSHRSSFLLQQWQERAQKARSAAHRILATHEAASESRVVILEDLLEKLDPLPVDIQNYFEEATGCLSHGFLRAAVVMSWAGFIHVVVEKMHRDYEKELRIERSKWTFSSVEDLKESYPEFQLIEAAKAVDLIDNSDMRAFKGQLTKRNRCAHPTLYRPSLNEALGYVDEMITQGSRFI